MSASDASLRNRRELFLRVACRGNFRVSFENRSVGSDQIGDAAREWLIFRVSRPVGDAYLARRVGDQREWEVELARELDVRFRRIEAAADDFRVALPVLVVKVPEPGPLIRSARCVRLRKEPEHDMLAAQCGE